MRWRPWFVRRRGVLLSMVVVLAGCTYDAAIQRLSPAEQAEFVRYRHIMTASQVHTYVAQPTAAARTTYLQQLGLAQRFQALDPLDQEAIRSGVPRVGMSADALQFLWGEPPAGTRTGTTWARPSHGVPRAIIRGMLAIAWMSISSGARSRGGWMCPRVVASGRAAARVATKGACI